MKRLIFTSCNLFLIMHLASATDYEIRSPDQRIQLIVSVDNSISWSVKFDGNDVIKKGVASMDFSTGPNFGIKPIVKKKTIEKKSQLLHPVVAYKKAEIKDEYVQLTLAFKDNYRMNFRAYNDGVVYQFIDDGKADRNVITEQMTLTFPDPLRPISPYLFP